MRIKVAERDIEVASGTKLFELRAQIKPNADIMVRNGAPVSEDCILQEGDAVVFIRRGEMPDRDELEALLVARHTPGVHERLRKAVVGIAGLGGLGSTVAIALARMGIGKLVLADYDIVEPSNLNRQQYFVDQLGLAKTTAISENLRRINPFVQVETHEVRLGPENVPIIFAEADVLVEAFDKASEKAMLLDRFKRAYPERPVVMASGLAGYESSNSIRTRELGKGIITVGDGECAACEGMGLMAPRVGIAACHQANAVLRLLLGLGAG